MRRGRKNPSVQFRTAKAHVESDPGTVASDNPNGSEPYETNVPGHGKVLGQKAKRNKAPKNERQPVRGQSASKR